MGFGEDADLLGAASQAKAQCCVRRSFPITAAGQPRNARYYNVVTGFPFQPAPMLGAGTVDGHKILWFDEGVNSHHNGDTSPSRIAARSTWVAVSAPSFCRMAD